MASKFETYPDDGSPVWFRELDANLVQTGPAFRARVSGWGECRTVGVMFDYVEHPDGRPYVKAQRTTAAAVDRLGCGTLASC